ncbi:MAG: 7-cyano-7-deazaguanine synthase [Patescibacteria group bacterium]
MWCDFVPFTFKEEAIMDNSCTVLKQQVLVLLSGGIDSAVCAAKLCAEGKKVHALSLRYPGDTNWVEINNATFLAKKLNILHVVLDFKFIEQMLGGTNTNMSFNVGGSVNNCVSRGKTPVPMSVELLHLTALMFARIRGIKHIYWAIHQDDLIGTSQEKVLEYLRALEKLPALGSYSPCNFETPFIGYSKKDMVNLGVTLDIDFRFTHSCSASSDVPCGVCRQCMLRASAFDSFVPLKQAVGA